MSNIQQPENFPPAQDSIEGTPQKQALNRLDKAEQIVGALNEGKLPTTNQVTSAIDKIEEQNLLHDAARNMSSMGKKVVADTERLLNTTKNMLNEKNNDDQFQKAIFHSNAAVNQIQESGQVDATRDVINSEGQKSAQLLRDAGVKSANIARLIATSSEFRKLLDDMNLIFQEIIRTKLPPQLSELNDTNQLAKDGTNMALDQAKDIARPNVEAYKQGQISGQDALRQTVGVASYRIQENLADLQLSQEQRNHFVVQIQNLMREIQRNAEYRQALQDLMDILEELGHHASVVSDHSQKMYSNQTNDVTLMEINSETASNANQNMIFAINNAKELVENFANGESLDPTIATIKEFGMRLKTDQELHKFLIDLKGFILQSAIDNDFLIDNHYVDMGSTLIERGRTLLVNSYQDLTYRLFDEIQRFCYGLHQDRTTSAFAKDLETLTSDLFMDDKGQPTIKYELVKDLSKIVPVIAKKMEYLPVPRIEGSDEEMDYILDNIVITCKNIIPKHVHIRTDTEFNTQKNAMKNILTFRVKHIQAEAKNIAFYYKKKTGIAKLSDVGLVDLIIPGDGLSFDMTIMPSASENQTFRALRVETQIEDMKLNIHDSQHQILYKFLGPFINSRVKKQMERVITEKLYDYINTLDESITQTSHKLKAATDIATGNTTSDQAHEPHVITSTSDQAHEPHVITSTPEWGSKKFDVYEKSL